MKKNILISAALLFVSCFANADDNVFACVESGQTSPYLTASYSTLESGASEVVITSYDDEGTPSVETLTGIEPELNVIEMIDKDGEPYVIIISFGFDDETEASKVRSLVCGESHP